MEINWEKKFNSWFAEPQPDHKFLVSQGANNMWYFSFNIGEKVWSSDPITRPFQNAEQAKLQAETVYKMLI